MKNPIRILMVEDINADFELVNWVLRKGGLSFRSLRVETEQDFCQKLEQHPPDVILSDHGLPSFDGFHALAITRERFPDLPFIFVTGAMGDDVAVDSMRRGATDYVLKSQLFKLVPAIERALRDAEERARWRQVEADQARLIQELKETLVTVKTLTGRLPICAVCKKVRKHPDDWLELETFLLERSDATIVHELCPVCAEKIPPAGGRLLLSP